MVSRKQGKLVQHLLCSRFPIIYFIFTTFCAMTSLVHGAVSLEEFLPYKIVDGAKRIKLNVQHELGFMFPYFGKEYTSVKIWQHGMLSFGHGHNMPMGARSCWWMRNLPPRAVMALSTELSIENGGDITLAVGQNHTLLEKLFFDISGAYDILPGALTNFGNFAVVTWNNVPHSYVGSRHVYRNTFQIILTTDGMESYLLFYFNKIQIPNKHRVKAAAGFIDDDGKMTQLPGTSCDGTIDNLVEGSNINVSGKWVYQVHEHVPEKTEETEPILDWLFVLNLRYYLEKISRWCFICE